MFRKSLIALFVSGSMTLTASSVMAQPYYPQPTQPVHSQPQPTYVQPANLQPTCRTPQPYYASYATPVQSRTFLLRFRAENFARQLQRQGYVVELRRTGLLSLRWKVFYRRA